MICYADNKKSSPFSFLLLLLALLLPFEAEGQKRNKNYDPQFLLQPFLGPEYARWLVGPIARIATEGEVEAYLTLSSDAEAEKFIDEFWRKREAEAGKQGVKYTDEMGLTQTPRQVFEKRAAEADSQYTEGSYRGRYTDRGTIFVLYGPPESTDYEVAPYRGGPPIEVWNYPKDAAEGFDGKEPTRVYRFIKDGELTTFYYHGKRLDRRRQLEEQIRNPTPY